MSELTCLTLAVGLWFVHLFCQMGTAGGAFSTAYLFSSRDVQAAPKGLTLRATAIGSITGVARISNIDHISREATNQRRPMKILLIIIAAVVVFIVIGYNRLVALRCAAQLSIFTAPTTDETFHGARHRRRLH